MEQPNPLIYETSYKTVVINDPSGIKVVNGIEVLDGGYVRQNGKNVSLYVKIEGKPDLAEMVKTWRAEWTAYTDYKAAEFAANVPGLDELEKAQDAVYNEEMRYSHQMDRMMEDEGNDGARPPAPLNETLRGTANDLAAKYPRAAIYLRAKGYTYSNNIDKYSAGNKAMEVIASGGSIEEANDLLSHWLPADRMFD